MKAKLLTDFQICISVPLMSPFFFSKTYCGSIINYLSLYVVPSKFDATDVYVVTALIVYKISMIVDKILGRPLR